MQNCQHKFDELAHDPRFTFLGNISIGTQPSSTLSTPSSPSPLTTLSSYTYPDALHLPLSSIRTHYNTILLTYGASLSNPLSSVSGSTSSTNPLKGVFPALAFVSWYNGHPAFSHLPPNLEDVEDVSIIGLGNVALDVARILLKSASSLAHTDLPESVLEVLSRSKVKRVTAVGRRGPGQVAFTPKEFREMINLPDVSFSGVDPGLVEQAKGMVEGDRMRKRLLGLMEKTTSGAGTKEFRLDFLKSPTAFVPSTEQPGRVGEVEWEINDLLAPPPAPPDPPASQDQSIPKPAVVARPTGKRVSTKADMMIESVGYRSEPLGMGEEGWELPFDIGRGRVRNVGGRVVEEGGIAVSSCLPKYLNELALTESRCRGCTPLAGQPEVQSESSRRRCTMLTPSHPSSWKTTSPLHPQRPLRRR